MNAPEVGQIRPSASPLLGAPGAYWREATRRGGRSLTCSSCWLCRRGSASPCLASQLRRSSPGTAGGQTKYLACWRGPGLPLLCKGGAREDFTEEQRIQPASFREIKKLNWDLVRPLSYPSIFFFYSRFSE